MKTFLLAAGVAAAVLTAGSALAAAKHPAMGAAVAPPKQPIPYAQLDSYLKASPAQRARKDWWSGQMATTGSQANTSASTPALPNDTPSGAPAATAAPAEPAMPKPDQAPATPPTSAPMSDMDKPH